MAYQIEITLIALKALEAITDRRTRSAIMRRIDTLAEEPEKQGKPLRGWLAGCCRTEVSGSVQS
jgi:mRNA interferase RelE/StbE